MNIKGKPNVHRWFDTTRCSNREDSGYVDFQAEAPAFTDSDPNPNPNAIATFDGCILSCPDEPYSLDYDGVRSVEDRTDLCPHTEADY